MSAASLAQLSNNLVYSAMAVYTLAMLAYAAEVASGLLRGRSTDVAASSTASARANVSGGVVLAERAPAVPDTAAGGSERAGRIAVSLTVLAFALHLAAVVARGLSAGRAPWGNMYEFSVMGGLAVTGTYLVLLRRWALRYLGIVVVPLALLILGVAVTVLYTDAAELVPALKSYWLVIHVLAAVLSSGAFTVGAALSAFYLVRERAERRGRVGAWLSHLPTAERLDRSAYTVHAFVFPLYTFAVIAGAIWAEHAWGRYWGWDPKETWSFITWIIYAGYLHARATAGWRGRKAAYIALFGYTSFTLNYFAINLIVSGLHSYAGV